MLDQPNQHNLQPGQAPDGEHHPCGRSWAVVHTHPQAEQWACDNLRRSGYDTFLPMALVSRPDRVVAGLTRSVLRPLFSRYAFIVINGPWAPARYCAGVANLVMAGSKPGIVARGAVEALQTAQALAATQPPDRPHVGLYDAVVARTGVFRGHTGVVMQLRGKQAVVSMLMFGELRHVSCDVTLLSKM